MSLSRLIYRNSLFFVLFILLSAIAGFWPGYLSQISGKDTLVHIHGALMSLWLVVLILQGTLIRRNHRDIHKQVGKLSYILAPLVFVSIATIRHNAMARADDPFSPGQLALLFPNAIAQPLLFAFTFLMAIYYRKESATHARFMLCTIIPSTGPIFNRIGAFYISSSIVWAPITNIIVMILLAFLSIWDWKERRRLNVFPVILALFVVFFVINRMISGTVFQMSFARWYLSLPLS
jgi:hypothetical protein